MHLLDGARTKIVRAQEHIRQLNYEINTFLQSKPYTISGEHRNDGKEYVFVVRQPPVIPLRFSAIIGDIIHNLRSSLDHLIYGLIVKNSGTPTNKNQFPICTTAEYYKEATNQKKCLHGVSDSAKSIIKSLQPYNTTPIDRSTLLAIHNCNNIDKHRLLIVTTAIATMGKTITINDNFDFTGVKNKNSNLTFEPEKWLKPKPMNKIGDVITTIRFSESNYQIHLEAEFTPQITFEKIGTIEYIPVIETVNTMLEEVSRIMQLFAQEF